MTLQRRGQEYSILVDGRELMNSRTHGSEEALARLGCDGLLDSEGARVLVGGLGMGFTLAAANQCLPKTARIDVAELVGAVVAWNRGPLGALCNHPLNDRRVRVEEGDIRLLLKKKDEHYDAILLDIDNGPRGLTQSSNHFLYGPEGLLRFAAALKPGGALSIWSAHRDGGFERRLRSAGFTTTLHTVKARSGRGGPKHNVWVARKARLKRGRRGGSRA